MRSLPAAALVAVLSSTGASAVDSEIPQIPEPMVFDLVRPLGARRGELEVNTLCAVPLTGRHHNFSWEPETEYEIGRGYAIEPQVIFENGTFEGFQLTGQKTMGTLFKHRAIHGLLLRGEYTLDRKQLLSDSVYLFGMRLSKRWSCFAINGFRRTAYWDGGRFVWLVNPTVFYHVNPRLEIGVESNFELGLSQQNRQLITPQFHYNITKMSEFQFGLGLEYGRKEHPRLLAIWRVVKQVR